MLQLNFYWKTAISIVLLTIHSLRQQFRRKRKASQISWNFCTQKNQEQWITVCKLPLKPHLSDRQNPRMVHKAEQIFFTLWLFCKKRVWTTDKELLVLAGRKIYGEEQGALWWVCEKDDFRAWECRLWR